MHRAVQALQVGSPDAIPEEEVGACKPAKQCP